MLKREFINTIKKFPYPLFMYTRPAEFWSYVHFFEKSYTWSEEETDIWELQKVKEMVDYAYNHVPFYNELYGREGYQCGDIKNWRDFDNLPVISKNDVKEHLKYMISDEFHQIPHIEGYTGGSTSAPMRFFLDKCILHRENAFYYCFWKQQGFRWGEKCVVLRGHKIANNNTLYQHDRFNNWLLLDSDYVTKGKYLKEYDAIIKQFQARVIQAYPSSLYNLAQQYAKSVLSPPRFDIVLLGSENTYEEHLRLIKDVFKVKTLTYNYGHSEDAIIATKYHECGQMGFWPVYGHMDLTDNKGQTIKRTQELGELIATGYSKCMPLIKYRTNDFAELSDYRSDDYMRNCKSVERIEGRLQEFIVTKDERLVSICTIGGAHIAELQYVKDMQYEQEVEGRFTIKVVEDKNRPLTEAEKRAIACSLEEKLEHKAICDVETVQNIPRTQRNKKVMIIQHLNTEDYL